MVDVKKGSFRILAYLVLVFTLLNVSGLTATAGTLITQATSNSCCDHGCDNTPAPAGPCSTPDCPCFSCISMVVSPSLSVTRDIAELLLTPFPPKHVHVSSYIRSIDYPPERP